MTKLLKGTAALILVTAMSVMAGCANYGGGGSADSAMMGDLLSERAVIRALYSEPQLTGMPILVGCVDGTIILSGTVESRTDANLAERVALGVDGVTMVQNNLISN